MSDLFPEGSTAMDSPRLAWMKKYNLYTMEGMDSNTMMPAWFAWAGHDDPKFKVGKLGKGAREEEALRDWGVNNGIKLWNEE